MSATRATASALCAVLVGCATIEEPRVVSSLTGELEPATPGASSVSRANTESSATVALGARRERVRDAVDHYLRAILDQDVERAMTVFADNTVTIEVNSPYHSIERMTAHHSAMLSGSYDLAFLRLELEREGSVVLRSHAEFRRAYPSGFVAVQPGDWVAELPFVLRAPYSSVARYLPRMMVFRFVGATVKVVAVSALYPLRM
jgi:hypothetical protein